MNVKTAQRDDWRTPLELYARLDQDFHFTVDAAADDKNALHEVFWTKKTNGLTQSWAGHRVFCNPPFSQKHLWAAKAAEGEAGVAVLILPATVEQEWFHRFVLGVQARIMIPQGRIAFKAPPGVKETSPRFASIIAMYFPIRPSSCIARSFA